MATTKRKRPPEYTADQLRELEAALIAHRDKLVSHIRTLTQGLGDYESICDLQETVSYLERTDYCVTDLIGCKIRIADAEGSATTQGLMLDECGLKWPA
jgi:hypothetical protein